MKGITMKRDLNLVREILNWAIDQEESSFASNPVIEGYSKEQVSYHVYLMAQANLVHAAIVDQISGDPEGVLVSITWHGHDFADAAKNNDLWMKAKNSLLKEGASFTFEYVKDWLRQHIHEIHQLQPFS